MCHFDVIAAAKSHGSKDLLTALSEAQAEAHNSQETRGFRNNTV